MTKDFKDCLKQLGKTDESPLSDQEWKETWKINFIPWHTDSVNGNVQRFFEKLRPNEKFNRIYVPLCGKTVDMAWLHEKGLTVIGCDIAEEAATSFMADHPDLKITKKIITLKDGQQIPLYESADQNIRIYICSYTVMPDLNEDKLDMVWDRGAFSALNPSLRQSFIDSSFKLLALDFRWLQTTMECPAEYCRLPPHTVSETDLRGLFRKYAQAEELSATPYKSERAPWCICRNMLYTPLEQNNPGKN